jgi:hypothetical protein
VVRAQNGRTALDLAAIEGHASVCTLLLENGADVNAKANVRPRNAIPPSRRLSTAQPRALGGSAWPLLGRLGVLCQSAQPQSHATPLPAKPRRVIYAQPQRRSLFGREWLRRRILHPRNSLCWASAAAPTFQSACVMQRGSAAAPEHLPARPLLPPPTPAFGLL